MKVDGEKRLSSKPCSLEYMANLMKIRTTVLLGQKCHTTPAGLGIGPRHVLGKRSFELEAPSFLPPRPDGDCTAEGQAASTVKTLRCESDGCRGGPGAGS